MTFPMLYPDESHDDIHRHSSIDQFKGFLSTWKQGGWAPIVFDQLDGITCETVKTHPVVISFGEDVGYIFPEAHCTYVSDKYIYFDKNGVEQRVLPSIFGGNGEMFDVFLSENTFINYDNDAAVGVSNRKKLRVGLSVVLADHNLPAEE